MRPKAGTTRLEWGALSIFAPLSNVTRESALGRKPEKIRIIADNEKDMWNEVDAWEQMGYTRDGRSFEALRYPRPPKFTMAMVRALAS